MFIDQSFIWVLLKKKKNHDGVSCLQDKLLSM